MTAFAAEQLARRPVELAQLVRAVGVVDRQHRLAMPDRAKVVDRRAADALRRAVRRDQFRMRLFDLLQFLEQSIELAVGDLRGRIDVVLAIVVVDQPAKFGSAIFGRHGGPEDRRQRTEDRGQKSVDRGQRTEVSRRTAQGMSTRQYDFVVRIVTDQLETCNLTKLLSLI